VGACPLDDFLSSTTSQTFGFEPSETTLAEQDSSHVKTSEAHHDVREEHARAYRPPCDDCGVPFSPDFIGVYSGNVCDDCGGLRVKRAQQDTDALQRSLEHEVPA